MERNVWTLSDSPLQKHRATQKKNEQAGSLNSAALTFETPPPDVVERLSHYAEDVDKNNDEQTRQSACYASISRHIESSPESSSVDSLFITQLTVPEAVRSARRSHPKPRSKLLYVTDDDEEDADEEGDGLSEAAMESVLSGIQSHKIEKGSVKRCSFPFLSNVTRPKNPKKSKRGSRSRGTHLTVRRNTSLASSAVGGFFKCMKSQSLLQRATEEPLLRYLDEDEPLSPISEPEEGADESKDVRVVDQSLHARFVQALGKRSSQKKNDTKGSPSGKEKGVSPKSRLTEMSPPSLLRTGKKTGVLSVLETVSRAEDNPLCSGVVVFSVSSTNDACERGKEKTLGCEPLTGAGETHGGRKRTTHREREEDTCDGRAPGRESWRPAGRPLETVLPPETVAPAHVEHVIAQTGEKDNASLKHPLGEPEQPSGGTNNEDKTNHAHKSKNKREKSLYVVVDQGVQQPSSQEESDISAIADDREHTPGLSESSRAEPAERVKKKKKKKKRDSLSVCDAAILPEEEESAVVSPPEGERKRKKRERDKPITPEEGQEGTVNRLHSEMEETTATCQAEFENRLMCGNVAELDKTQHNLTPVSFFNRCTELRGEEHEYCCDLEVVTLPKEDMAVTERKKKHKKRRVSSSPSPSNVAGTTQIRKHSQKCINNVRCFFDYEEQQTGNKVNLPDFGREKKPTKKKRLKGLEQDFFSKDCDDNVMPFTFPEKN